MADADALAQTQELTTEAAPPPALPSTGSPLMDMAQQASARGDVDTLAKLLAMRDAEDERNARQAFNAAFAAAQAEFPVIPQRGRGHNGLTYARVEDIIQGVMPVLAKHGLSVRHRADTSSGVTVTCTLAHVDGHSETDTFVAAADKTGSKNDVQAIKSTITYARRTTIENLLGLASHGEDDDAFATGDTDKVAEYRERAARCAPTKKAYLALRADLVKDLEMSGAERAQCETILKKLFAALPSEEKGA